MKRQVRWLRKIAIRGAGGDAHVSHHATVGDFPMRMPHSVVLGSVVVAGNPARVIRRNGGD